MTGDGKISIMRMAKLHFEYFRKENSIMNAIKMGMTIEEAAETSGIGRNTMRKLVEWGKLPVLKVGRKNHYPQGYAGTLYDRQSGQKSTVSG